MTENHEPLTFRHQVSDADRATVGDLVAGTGFFTPAEVAVAVELVEERLSRGPASGYEFLFAERAGQVVGYTCYGPIAATEGSFDLYWIAVEKGRQGGGIGRRLMAETERRIAAAGGRRIYAETSGRAEYAPTRAFYQRCGYVEEARLADFYRVGDDKVIYVKAAGMAAHGTGTCLTR
jgi:ribosomal protein S18 acetylase RimI-like enzyme